MIRDTKANQDWNFHRRPAYNSEFKAVIQLNIQSQQSQTKLRQIFISSSLGVLIYLAFGVASRLLEDSFGQLGLDAQAESAEFQGLATVAFVTLIWTLFSSATQLTFLAKRFLPKTQSLGSLNPLAAVNQLAIENTRSLSACIIRIPLAVIPAIIEWLRLMPVPYIVLLDAEYERGQIDVLKASRRFFSANKLFVLALTLPLILGFVAELLLTDSPLDAVPIWQAPFQHIGSITLVALIRFAIDGGVLWAYWRRLGPNSGRLQSTTVDPITAKLIE